MWKHGLILACNYHKCFSSRHYTSVHSRCTLCIIPILSCNIKKIYSQELIFTKINSVFSFLTDCFRETCFFLVLTSSIFVIIESTWYTAPFHAIVLICVNALEFNCCCFYNIITNINTGKNQMNLIFIMNWILNAWTMWHSFWTPTSTLGPSISHLKCLPATEDS